MIKEARLVMVGAVASVLGEFRRRRTAPLDLALANAVRERSPHSPHWID